MYKVTQHINVYLAVVVLASCNPKEPVRPVSPEQQQDSVASARIDSAYAAISLHCDTMMHTRVPVWADSLLAGDSSALIMLKDSSRLYTGADAKSEKVIRALLADCRASLLAGTYKTAQRLQALRPTPRNPRKAARGGSRSLPIQKP